MNKQERNRLYKKALKFLQGDGKLRELTGHEQGGCVVLQYVTNKLNPAFEYDEYFVTNNFPEFEMFRKSDDLFRKWFDSKDEREQAIIFCIEMTK